MKLFKVDYNHNGDNELETFKLVMAENPDEAIDFFLRSMYECPEGAEIEYFLIEIPMNQGVIYTN